MAKSKSSNGTSFGSFEVPTWGVVAAVFVVIIVVMLIAWKTLGPPSGGKSIKVHPNMYNFRQEFLKGNVGRHPQNITPPANNGTP